MYDLIIIGSGPGGYRAADYAAKQGLQVLIVEKAEAGGTCLNCGCIPTKTLCHEAELLHAARQLSTVDQKDTTDDVSSSDRLSAVAKSNFAHIMERKRDVIAQLRNGVEQLLGKEGITWVKGTASLVDKNHVRVDAEVYEAKHIIIATGSSAKVPTIKGIESKRVVSSTELLEIDTIPQRLCIVGAGVIGMEFASIFASLGSEVTVVEFLKECLPSIDSDIAKRLRKLLEKRGVVFHMQAAVTCIDDGTVSFERKGKQQQVNADCILIATGRQPNTDGLNLESVGVKTWKGGIEVDDHMQTSVSGIYAIGDVNGRCLLAHAATFQGFRAVNHILNKPDGIRFDIMPAAVFTLPEVACVGITADQALGTPVRELKGFYRSNGKALSMNETDGMVKLVVDEKERILGCHVLGAHAADLVQEIAVVMNCGGTLDVLRNTIHTHPTLAEILQDIALGAK